MNTAEWISVALESAVIVAAILLGAHTGRRTPPPRPRRDTEKR